MPQANILLPSWHLEDVSRDLKEKESAAILNGYALALHPWVLAASHGVPRWVAAPSPGDIEKDRILILPEPSRAKLPSGWLVQAQEQGVIVLHATASRSESLQLLEKNPQLRELLAAQPALRGEGDVNLEISPARADDFVALGTVYLLTQLLSQAMYHYDNIDETRFTDFLLEAARCAIRQEPERTGELFQLACEQLLESREKFYPVEANLIDLCLLGEGIGAAEVDALLSAEHLVNVLCTGETVERLEQTAADARAALAEGFRTEKLALLGGEYRDAATPLLPLQAGRWQLAEGLAIYERLLGTTPKVWMRMRYGLSTQLPLLLTKFGISCAYHLVLDDGTYPDDEQSHFAWEGRSSSIVQAISRIPLSVENASSLLRIPERMAEAMNHDHLACVVLARWPTLKNPWFQDLVRIQQQAPVLGRFARLDQFLLDTVDSGHQTNHEQRLYQSPYLDQLTGHKQADPLSRFQHFWEAQTQLQILDWARTTRGILTGRFEPDDSAQDQSRLQQQAVAPAVGELSELTEQWNQQFRALVDELSEIVSRTGKSEPGYLVWNPLAHPRTEVIRVPLRQSGPQKLMPRLGGAVKHLQLDGEECLACVEIPASGFAVLPLMPTSQFRAPRQKAALAGETFLQNEFFHVQIDPETGGIQRLRVHGSTENLLSQRLVFRLDGSSGAVPRTPASGVAAANEPTYTRMVADSVTLTQAGAVRGQIEVHGKLLAGPEQVIAEFTQRIIVQRGSRRLRLEIELTPRTLPTHLSDRSYYALRFAWAASAAKVRGTLQQSQFLMGERRCESTGPIQIEDDGQTITLLPDFLPFHQRTAPRLLDSLLIVQGETRRKFVYEIAINAAHASMAAAAATVPPLLVPVEKLPAAASAWLMFVSAPSVHLVGCYREMDEQTPDDAQTRPACYRFDFIETEGKHSVTRFALCRRPQRAWEVDFRGQIQAELTIEDDQILLECLPCDYVSVRVEF